MVAECTSHFVLWADWMQIPMDGETQHGKITCPKCQASLGDYAHYGAQCSCGRFVCPAYKIHKSKVDIKTNIDLTKN